MRKHDADLVKFIFTAENWYPTKNNRVRVTFGQLTTGWWRVSVWGADDFGLEVDLQDKTEARKIFRRIVDGTTQAQLRAWGLVNA